MKNRKFWTITGSLGVVAMGAGAAVADSGLFTGSSDLGSGIHAMSVEQATQSTPAPSSAASPSAAPSSAAKPSESAPAKAGPSVVKDADFTQRGASAASPATPSSPGEPGLRTIAGFGTHSGLRAEPRLAGQPGVRRQPGFARIARFRRQPGQPAVAE